MSFDIQIITDLAILMVVASAVAIIFYKLKQPLIIGYLVAGIIIGPYTLNLTTNMDILNVFAEIGVILLLFTIGLEFPIQKLRSIGRVVIGVSAIEITMMLLVSYAVGTFLDWGFYNTLFLGAALASSSTTIIAKILSDMGKIKEISSLVMLGILVVEDVIVVVLLAVVQEFVVVNAVSAASTLWLAARLAGFIGGTLIIGGLLVPRVVDRVVRIRSRELLYMLMLGICFAFAIMANQAGFSAAIGAFLIGVVVARSRYREVINRKIGPFKLVFGAIFFVSMGALMDFTQIGAYWIPAVIVTVTVVVTKLASCGLGTWLFRHDKKTSIRVGLGMAQIGEFAFIAAKTGQDLGVTSSFLLPVLGVATMISTFLTPYLIKLSFADEPKKVEPAWPEW